MALLPSGSASGHRTMRLPPDERERLVARLVVPAEQADRLMATGTQRVGGLLALDHDHRPRLVQLPRAVQRECPDIGTHRPGHPLPGLALRKSSTDSPCSFRLEAGVRRPGDIERGGGAVDPRPRRDPRPRLGHRGQLGGTRLGLTRSMARALRVPGRERIGGLEAAEPVEHRLERTAPRLAAEQHHALGRDGQVARGVEVRVPGGRAPDDPVVRLARVGGVAARAASSSSWRLMTAAVHVPRPSRSVASMRTPR